ncbi:MAG: T9SS type A sorting domain-containing protein [Flavobacteriaceae bacterium]|nr:T9SS type A sorting domain-containing protein [Flavobacteriaceae bacterium]
MRKNYFSILLILVFSCVQFVSAQNLNPVIQQYLSEKSGELGLTTQDISEWRVTDIVPSLNPEIKHVYVRQFRNGVPVHNTLFKLNVKNGQEVVWHINQFIPNLDSKISSSSASLTAADALQKLIALRQLRTPSNLSPKYDSEKEHYVFEKGNAALEDITVKQIYYPTGKEIRLAWDVSYYQLDAEHWWNTKIDATTGEALGNDDWVLHCDFGSPEHGEYFHNEFNPSLHDNPGVHNEPKIEAVTYGPVEEAEYCPEEENMVVLVPESYNVYAMPVESPSHGNRTTELNPFDAVASPFGWHDTNGTAGAEHTITRGNNVWAYEDTGNNNSSIGNEPDGGAGLVFDFPIDLVNDAPAAYQDAAVTNLFYWSNIMHDVYYRYGFDEASGNFQENNYGNGGVGGDSCFCEAQDGSGTNNANFSTPPDGGNGRMQMYIWTAPNPDRDGDLDNGIITHEYGHGISIRIVGGPATNGLGGSEQMGEGWSDWFGLVLTMNTGDTADQRRGVGTYALNQPTTGNGIRPAPYSRDMAINPFTYDDIGGLAVPHGVGYGWASIIWDMTWDLIDDQGFDLDFYTGTGGNNIAMALVIEGLKNTPNNPGFVSGRDAILQADTDLYGGAYACLIWDAFARRGVGLNADEGSTGSNGDNVSDFTSGCDFNLNTPTQVSACVGAASVDINFDFTATGTVPTTTFAVTAGLPAGTNATFTPPSASTTTAVVLTVGNLATVPVGDYTLTIEGAGTAGNKTQDVLLKVVDNTPLAVQVLTSPSNGATDQAPALTLTWAATANAADYQVQVSTNPSFTTTIVDTTVNVTTYDVTGLIPGEVYYWRVLPSNACVSGAFSESYSFQVGVNGCTTYADAPGTVIPTSVDTVTTTIDVPTGGAITDINVYLDISHTWVGDLNITLESPATTTVNFANLTGCGNVDDVDATFDDEAAAAINCGNLATGQTFIPSTALSGFDGEDQAGTWTLSVTDTVAADGGTINNWSMEICIPVSNPAPTFTGGFTVTAVSTHTVLTTEMDGATSFAPADVQYTMVVLPTEGNLELNSIALGVGDTFTQTDIDSGFITYTNTYAGCPTNGSDSFVVDIRDTNQGGWLPNQNVAITIDCALSTQDVNAGDFKIYPNPASDIVNIEVSSYLGDANITIFDINGRRIISTENTLQGVVTVPVASLQTGVYLMKIEGENFTHTAKLLVQ